MDFITSLLATLGGTLASFFGLAWLQDRWLKQSDHSVVNVKPFPEPQNGPVSPVPAPIEEKPAPAPDPRIAELSWADPRGAFKLTRIMADEMGLTLKQKNILCGCIYQESRFRNRYADGRPVTNENEVDGKVWSTDWGIAQINDTKGWHIGPGLPFPSVEYVLAHPEEAVRYMIKMQKAGKLSLWSSYKFGHYKQWLSPDSPMWALKPW